MSDGQNAKIYDFDCIGESVEVIAQKLLPLSGSFSKPFGIKTPLEMGFGTAGLLKMHHDIGRQISDNFRNMIATNHGERKCLSDFGGNLLPLAFDLTTENADKVAARRIKKTTEKYMPFIHLVSFEPFREEPIPQYLAKSGVRVNYQVPTLGLTGSIEVIIYAGA